MGFTLSSSGSYEVTKAALKKMGELNVQSVLNSAGQQGINALTAATPVNSGLAANSWSYTVSSNRSSVTITWFNNDVENGFPVAIALQYGYGTGTGGYVAGRDYINPAMRPIFDNIADQVWKAVTSA